MSLFQLISGVWTSYFFLADLHLVVSSLSNVANGCLITDD